MPAGRLDDILAPDLRILLVAINPAPLSLGVGQHFATPTNAFWNPIHAPGLTSRLFRPDEAPDLLSEGIGLTSLVSRATRAAAELTRAEQRAGALTRTRTVERWKPRVVARLGLTLFPVVCPDADEPGPGLKRARLAGSAI